MNQQINFEGMFEYLDLRARHYLSGAVALNFDEIVVYPYTTTLRNGEPDSTSGLLQSDHTPGGQGDHPASDSFCYLC